MNLYLLNCQKKPRATSCGEHRTLSLMSHILKILLRIILHRIRPKIESEIDGAQSGFMSGKGTREGIFNIKMIMEKYLEVKKDVYVCFIDYEKAFDRVSHGKMIQCLNDIGIKGKDIRLIQNLYWTQRSFIRMDNGLSNGIDVKRGVRQGCVLSPALFNLYTETIFRNIHNMPGVKINDININNLRYADDTVLIAEDESNLQAITDRVNECGRAFNMKMNAKKTFTMVITSSQQKPSINIKIDGNAIKQVSKFVYLGHMLTDDGKCEHEIKRRIELARAAFRKLNNVLTCRRLNMEIRKRILRCYVFSTLLYGAETWTITKPMEDRIKAFELWTYRRMLKISWTAKVSNEEVLEKVKPAARVMDNLKVSKLKYFGHINRHETLQRELLNGKPEGRRGRGRPRIMWIDNITKWTNMQIVEARRATLRRRPWRITASDPRREDGT